jgi:multisubunit Na+/H+ antiporter MnhE subunit
MKHRASALLGVLIGGAFYLLLIDTVSTPELYAGLAAVLLAAAGFEVSREIGLAEATFAPSWLGRAWRVLVRVPLHIVLVSWTAVAQLLAPRGVRGRFRAVPFRAGGEDPRNVGRRALSEALGSLAPNTIVVGIDPDENLLLVHQLHVHGGREELDSLGLG